MDDSRRPGNFSSTIFEWVIALLSLSFRRCCFFFWGGYAVVAAFHIIIFDQIRNYAQKTQLCVTHRDFKPERKSYEICVSCAICGSCCPSPSARSSPSPSSWPSSRLRSLLAQREKKNRVCILRLYPFLTRNQNLYPQGWFYCWLSVLGNTPCRDQFFRFSFSQCSRDRFNKRHNGKSSSWRTTQSKSKVLWWTAANATAVVQSAPSQCTTAMLVMVVVPHEWHTFNGCTSFTFILGVCPTFDFKCNLCTCHSASW